MTWLHKATFWLAGIGLLLLFIGAVGPGLAMMFIAAFVGYLAHHAI